MVKYLRLSSYIRNPSLIYDFILNFLIYEENFLFFLSVQQGTPCAMLPDDFHLNYSPHTTT
jgi:hypothetical protein